MLVEIVLVTLKLSKNLRFEISEFEICIVSINFFGVRRHLSSFLLVSKKIVVQKRCFYSKYGHYRGQRKCCLFCLSAR